MQVGDGLEMFVVLSPASSAQLSQQLQGMVGLEEVTTAPREGGEKVFVIRRNLKRD